MEILCTGNGAFWKETLDTFPTSACRLELLNWDYNQLSSPTPDLWALWNLCSPGPSSLLEKSVKCWSSLETQRMSWKCSPLIIITSKHPPDPSPPPSRAQTECVLWQSQGSGAASCQPRATCCLFHQMAQVEHKEQSASFCWPPSAYSPAAEVTEDVGLNPSGTGSRSSGFSYQNTACCSDTSHHQQLSGKGEHWLLFGQRSQKEAHSCILRHERSISACVCDVLARCPTFFISSGLWCSATAALDKVLKNFLLKEGDPIRLRHFQSQADTVLGGLKDLGE